MKDEVHQTDAGSSPDQVIGLDLDTLCFEFDISVFQQIVRFKFFFYVSLFWEVQSPQHSAWT